MPKSLEGTKSPFERAAAEGLTGNPNSNPNTIKKRRGRPPDGTADWAPVFIGALMEGASIRKACRIAGVDITMPYTRRKHDTAFVTAWREASDIGTELMEQEAARRAFHGTLKPVFHRGEQCGVVREYSDTLMIFMLKARKPEVYREGGEEGTVRGNFVLNINVEAVDKVPTLLDGLVEVVVDKRGEQDREGLPEAAAVLAE